MATLTSTSPRSAPPAGGAPWCPHGTHWSAVGARALHRRAAARSWPLTLLTSSKP
eukprot:CAMPEP_0171272048 /NCGR_PEP_ID=MMETSP0790-20130122/61548_1 /TAXON_ID=2925 /ORGANISM="Alexandrium catenella, Strain OF101" /LENGTH=54 /DNA_ID=CAMNT_0011740953 /DNA_START=79 /DNA_END=239 /DNA_ORIENTATION=+